MRGRRDLAAIVEVLCGWRVLFERVEEVVNWLWKMNCMRRRLKRQERQYLFDSLCRNRESSKQREFGVTQYDV